MLKLKNQGWLKMEKKLLNGVNVTDGRTCIYMTRMEK